MAFIDKNVNIAPSLMHYYSGQATHTDRLHLLLCKREDAEIAAEASVFGEQTLLYY